MVDKLKDKKLKAIAEASLFDDKFMTIVFDRNLKATQLLLNVVLERDDLTVLEAVSQREYKSPIIDGRSIKLDIYAEDDKGKIYDIEVQQLKTGADVKRARFYSSMLDTKMLKARDDFKDINESYVIFITLEDIFGESCSLYHIDRIVQETGKPFNDGAHIIYVNGEYENANDPVGRLMHDFKCIRWEDMYYPELAESVEYFKKDGGEKIMVGQVFEKYAKEYAEEYAKEYAEEYAIEKIKEKSLRSASQMIKSGKLAFEDIAEFTDLPLDEIKTLAESMKN